MSNNITRDDLTNSTLRPAPINQPTTLFVPTRALIPPSSFPVVVGNQPVKTASPFDPNTSIGANPSGKNGVPLALLTVAAVQTPVAQQSYTNCNVTVSFTRNNSDVNFDHVNIWFIGYHGSTTPQLMSAGTTSPLNFLCDATKETVRVLAQPASVAGDAAPLAFAIGTNLTLSGTVSAPPAPTISQSLVGTPTGYQFGFNQVILPAGDEEVIANYNIYRATVNSFAGATIRATITPNQSLIGAVIYTDTINDATGAAYYYWVTAVNTAGYESTATPAQSGIVAGSIGALPPSLSTPFKITTTSTSVTIATSPSCFFTRADGTQVLIGSTSTSCTGLPTGNTVFFFPYWRESDQTMQFVAASDCAIPNITGVLFAAASSQYVETTTGASIPATFSLELWMKGSTAGALADFSAPQVIGTTTASVMQLQATSAGEIKFSIHNTVSNWVSITTVGASVLDGTWHHILVVFTGGGAGVGSIFVDGANTSDDVTFWTDTSMGTLLSTTGYWHFGVIGGLSGAPITSTLYNSFTLSHIALYDTTLTSIQAAAHLNAFANLSEAMWIAETFYDSAVNLWKLTETTGTSAADSVGSNTGTYKASPTLNQTSSVVTILGSPMDAFPYNYFLALQQQFLRNRTPLSSTGISASTATSGSQSGGGSGGGSGGSGRGGGYCFTGNTLIKTQRGDVPIRDVISGDLCLTAAGNWIPVSQRIEHAAERLILHAMPNGEFVTFSHKILRDSEWVNAGLVFTETKELNEPVYTLTMDSTEHFSEMLSPNTERSFTLCSGAIAHNMQPIK